MPKKLNENISYSDKLLKLFGRMFFNPGPRSLTDLARELGCSKQAVGRLVSQIESSYQVRIEREMRGNRLYYVFDSPKKFSPKAGLSASDLNTMQMCRAFTEHLLGVGQFGDAMLAIEKSTKMLPQDVALPEGNFGALRFGTIDYTPFQKQLETLVHAMENKKVCEIMYKRILDKRSTRHRIKPLKIFAYKETIYIHARYAKIPGKVFKPSDHDPLLALQRIKKATPTPTSFRMPDNYDFERVMNRHFGVMSGKKFLVKARFTGWAAGFVQERVWSTDQKVTRIKDGSINIEFSATSETEVLNWILTFADEGILLGPKPLVKKLKTRLAAVAAQY
jgi:predicted DNA-binding transcriptional regulator YafY